MRNRKFRHKVSPWLIIISGWRHLRLEALYVFGSLDRELAARRAGALAGGTDHPRYSGPQFWNGHAGHRNDRPSGHHHRAHSAIHRVPHHLSDPGPVPPGAEFPPPETGVHVHAGLPHRRVPQRPAWLPGADDPRYRFTPAGVGYSINVLAPSNSAEMAEALRDAAAARRPIALAGSSPQRRMAGRVDPADVALTTLSLRGVLQYEPRDLTISVSAGLSWREFTHLLAENRQMVPLDPPFADGATVGGVISANCSGPRRRLYGTARDLVIGMQFATLEGKLVKSGGMVVKNVAGLDMAKLMIGSFGTLAAITVVNFKLQPMPEVDRSFLLPFDSLAAAMAARNVILTGQLQPAAIDLLNPAAARTVGGSTWLVALRAAGNAAAVERYEREFAHFTEGMAFEEERHETLWRHVENFTPQFLAANEDGAVVRASCTDRKSTRLNSSHLV